MTAWWGRFLETVFEHPELAVVAALMCWFFWYLLMTQGGRRRDPYNYYMGMKERWKNWIRKDYLKRK